MFLSIDSMITFQWLLYKTFYYKLNFVLIYLGRDPRFWWPEPLPDWLPASMESTVCYRLTTRVKPLESRLTYCLISAWIRRQNRRLHECRPTLQPARQRARSARRREQTRGWLGQSRGRCQRQGRGQDRGQSHLVDWWPIHYRQIACGKWSSPQRVNSWLNVQFMITRFTLIQMILAKVDTNWARALAMPAQGLSSYYHSSSLLITCISL